MTSNRISRILLSFGLSLLANLARADMIDDIDQLDQEKPVVPAKGGKGGKSPSPAPSPTTPPRTQGSKGEAATPVPAATPKAAKKSEPSNNPDARREPVHIKSDGQLTYARSGGIIHMTQNVVITQGEMRFQADEARVWVKEGGDADNNVEKVECIGNVKVSKFAEDPAEKITARGQRAFFYNDQRKVILQGEARLWRGGHLIKGAQITYMLDDGMITVDRAEGIVQPEDNGKKKAGATASPAPSPSPTASPVKAPKDAAK